VFLGQLLKKIESAQAQDHRVAVGVGTPFVFPRSFDCSKYEHLLVMEDEVTQHTAIEPTPVRHRPPFSHTHACAMDRLCLSVSTWISRLFPDNVDALARLPDLVSEAYSTTNLVFNEQDALRWAEGFQFPDGIGDRDSAALRRHGYDLTAMAAEFQSNMPNSRLSHDSVNEWVSPSNPDFNNIHELSDGVPFLVPDNFVPNGAPYGLRKKYIAMASVINRLLFDLYEKKLCIIVHTSDILKVQLSTRFGPRPCKPLQYSSVHWTTKRGKPKGRPLGDSSAEESGQPLNSDEVKAMIDDRWGQITHPTINRLAQMILRVAATHGWDKILLYKMDLRGAFSLLKIRPEDVGLCAFELTDGLTLLHTTGWFGWTGMPGTFQVVTRVIVSTVREHPTFSGEVDMFVDDVLGVCLDDDTPANLLLVEKVATGVLGSDAVEGTKTDFGRALDWIGWRINLDSRTVSVARHNMLKTLYGFFVIDTTARARLKDLQTLASWSARYSMICRYMRPHTSTLFDALKVYKGRTNIALPLSVEVIVCIQLWRACLSLLDLQEARFARDLLSFNPGQPKLCIEFDASLTGIGIIVNIISPEGTEHPWKALAWPLPYALHGDASFQNSVEFIAIVVGFAGIARAGVRKTDIAIRGDNQSSLAWALQESFRSPKARNAGIVYTFLGIEFDLRTSSANHIAGVSNIVADSWSRAYSRPQSLGYNDRDLLFPDDDHVLPTLLSLMDPTHLALDTCETATSFLTEVGRATTALRPTSCP